MAAPTANLVSVDVINKRRPAPAPIEQVRVVVNRPGQPAQALTATRADACLVRVSARALDGETSRSFTRPSR